MIQFTQEEIEKLKERAVRWPHAAERLKAGVKDIFESPVLVPETGIGNWSLYYYCPDCSVSLEFNWNDSHHHRCPSCGQVFSGEPYDSTWWGLVNSKNYNGAFRMAVLYLITGEEAYLTKASSIMLGYARHYRKYEVHGNIPYNGPGKAGAQTLDEANFLRSFAMTYDILADHMTEDERETVRDELLIPGAEFLIQHRHNQLHNHEVIIDSAIAVIGLIFDIRQFIQFAVYEPYGLIDQLEKGRQDNNMWFEGAFGYHFYALNSFFAYEKFALHTEHSHIHHHAYRAMMELLVSYLEPGFHIPMLNDTNYAHTNSCLYLYEFAYREIGGRKLLYILNELYRREERDNLEAFLYGAEELPECKMSFSSYHSETGKPGHTILRGKNEKYLLFKHDRYGGEHDHYDRLAISYQAGKKRVSPDLGTTGYGARMHYDYYKNTGSHNTVNIGGENQAPVNAVLKHFEEQNGVVYVEAAADWRIPYKMPDSFIITQWSEENYRNVVMERKLAWTEDYFIDLFSVKGVKSGLPIDWVMHFSGETVSEPEGVYVKCFSEQKPYRYLHSVKRSGGADTGAEEVVTIYRDGNVTTCVMGWNLGQTVFCGKGPDNPSVSEINYRIERCYGSQTLFIHLITSYEEDNPVKRAVLEQMERGVAITVTERDKTVRRFEWEI